MTKRYFLEIAYKGTNYCGWQVQPKQVTVQSTLNHALSTILNTPTSTLGCGRTDSGVHARQFFVHFDTTRIPENFVFRLNKFLPPDIAIKRLISDVPPKAHTRFDATYRAYDYYVHFNKDPFLTQHSLYFPWLPLDIAAMEQAVQQLPQYTNFPMFCKSGHDSKTTLCTIFTTNLQYDEVGGTLHFHIAANRFLRGMIRRIMGCLLMIGKGKISLYDFTEVMEQEKPAFKQMNLSVAPQGLYLSEVRYPYL